MDRICLVIESTIYFVTIYFDKWKGSYPLSTLINGKDPNHEQWCNIHRDNVKLKNQGVQDANKLIGVAYVNFKR